MSTLTDVRCRCGAAGQRETAHGRFSDMLNATAWMCATCVEADQLAESLALTTTREAELADRMRRRLEQLPPKLRNVHFIDLQRTAGNAPALDAASEWALGDTGGLMLCGPIGLGKTTVAAGAARLMMRRRRVTWTSVPTLLANALAAFDDEGRAEALRVLTGGGALALDDLDKVKASEWASAQLFAAIDARYAAGAPLLVTSNLTPSELVGRLHPGFADAIASRLVEYCRVVVLRGEDRRLAGAPA